MKIKSPTVINTDVLIIGGGIAGLRAAIEARKQGVDVLLVSRTRAGYSNNSVVSKGGFCAACPMSNAEDTPEIHFQDTISAGRFINDPKLVEVMVYGIEQQIYDLEQFGVNFRKKEGKFDVFGPLPGHSFARMFCVESGNGAGITLPLRHYAINIGIRFIEGITITRLLKTDEIVTGAIGINKTDEVLLFGAGATVLASGGLGQLFLRTDNTPDATGDGYALAYEAGVPLIDMEFVQYYPTRRVAHNAGPGVTGALYEGIALIGGVMKNSLGEDILEKYGIQDPRAMTRDMVSRAIMTEITEGRDINGGVIIDYTAASRNVLERLGPLFIAEKNREQLIFPVAPVAQYAMGGVEIDENARTNLAGLYAAGEICGGVHGANRLGGNSLTECLVFGTIAGKNAARGAQKYSRPTPSQRKISIERERLNNIMSATGDEIIAKILLSLKKTTWHKAGIIRNKENLQEALLQIRSLRSRAKKISLSDKQNLSQAFTAKNMLITAEIICKAALKRTESRGAHYRTDHAKEGDEKWLRHIKTNKTGNRLTPFLE